MPRDDFLRALLRADVLVGNSSCGLIEAPFAGTPAVNVGDRQDGRLAGGNSVVRAAESFDAIRRAIERVRRLPRRSPAYTVYGDGHAGRRIAAILAAAPIGSTTLRKRISY
jgi:UDP-N-acetylglucosamine 2-epimerase